MYSLDQNTLKGSSGLAVANLMSSSEKKMSDSDFQQKHTTGFDDIEEDYASQYNNSRSISPSDRYRSKKKKNAQIEYGGDYSDEEDLLQKKRNRMSDRPDRATFDQT